MFHSGCEDDVGFSLNGNLWAFYAVRVAMKSDFGDNEGERGHPL